MRLIDMIGTLVRMQRCLQSTNPKETRRNYEPRENPAVLGDNNVAFPHDWTTEQAAEYRRLHSLSGAEWEGPK